MSCINQSAFATMYVATWYFVNVKKSLGGIPLLKSCVAPKTFPLLPATLINPLQGKLKNKVTANYVIKDTECMRSITNLIDFVIIPNNVYCFRSNFG